MLKIISTKKTLFGLVLAVPFLVVACGHQEIGGAVGSAIEIRVAAVASGQMVKTIEFSGVLSANQASNLTGKMGGQVLAVNADVGSKVVAGQVLVQIDARELAAQLQLAQATVNSVRDQIAQAQLSISQSQNSLDFSQKNFERSKALFDTQSVSKSEYDDARNKLDLARMAVDNAIMRANTLKGSSLAQAEAQLRLIEVQISNSRIASPLDGVVVSRNINPGEMASPGAPLMTVADTRSLKLQGNIGQDVIALLSVGQSVAIAIDGFTGGDLTGRISQIGPMAAVSGQYFPVVVTLVNPGRLMAGMTARASFRLTIPSSIIVPTTAVKTESGQTSVFVVDGSQVTERVVKIGIANKDHTQIVSGLTGDELVAVSNASMLHADSKVTVVQ